MIIGGLNVEHVSRLREGKLEEVSFAVLLYVLARTERSVTLEINRPPLHKKIIIDRGVPVQCTSNLVHETLSRFMTKTGRLDEKTADECFNESCSRGVRFGEVLTERGIVTPAALRKVLQENLAHKLLDGFSWHHGRFNLTEIPADVDSSLHVNVPQLIVLGVTRFATQDQVDGSIGPLIGKPLALNPAPFFAVDDLRLSPQHGLLAEALEDGALRIDELASTTGMAYDELTRLLYALTLIDIVLPADRLPEAPVVDPPPVEYQKEEGDGVEASSEAGPEEAESRKNELFRLALRYRNLDAFELLGVDPDGINPAVDDRFLEFAEKYAPWSYGEDLVEEAREVFLAGARAYAELRDPIRRKQLVTRRTEQHRSVAAVEASGRFRSTSNLFDSEVQYKKGKFLLSRGDYRGATAQLAYACDIDPQNAKYRAELALCRFLCDPSDGGRAALDELQETLRIDPRCGLVHFCTGEVLRQVGRYDEAQKAYERAIKPMAPDRRPIDALRAMLKERKARANG